MGHLMVHQKEYQREHRRPSLSLGSSTVAVTLHPAKIYIDRCAVCHQASGAGIPGAFPAITGSKIATGKVSDHIDIIVNGRSGTAMQSFANQLSDKEIAAVVTYQRNGLGNNTGDLVQASDVNAFKASKEGQ